MKKRKMFESPEVLVYVAFRPSVLLVHRIHNNGLEAEISRQAILEDLKNLTVQDPWTAGTLWGHEANRMRTKQKPLPTGEA